MSWLARLRSRWLGLDGLRPGGPRLSWLGSGWLGSGWLTLGWIGHGRRLRRRLLLLLLLLLMMMSHAVAAGVPRRRTRREAGKGERVGLAQRVSFPPVGTLAIRRPGRRLTGHGGFDRQAPRLDRAGREVTSRVLDGGVATWTGQAGVSEARVGEPGVSEPGVLRDVSEPPVEPGVGGPRVAASVVGDARVEARVSEARVSEARVEARVGEARVGEARVGAGVVKR